MRQRQILFAGVVLLVAPLATESLVSGQQGRRPDDVQVGVPQGRDGGQGRQGIVGGLDAPREDLTGRPVPRGPDGRVLFGGATPEEKGVWLPGRGGVANPVSNPE